MDIVNGIENKQDALKFLTEESLSFFRRFAVDKDTLGLSELDALNDIRAKLSGGIVLVEQLIISATINGVSSPQIYSQVRKHLVDIHTLTKGLLTEKNTTSSVLNIRKLLVKIKYLLPREAMDYKNFEKLMQKVQAHLTAKMGSLAEIIQVQKDFALLAFLGNNLFGEELNGAADGDKALISLKANLLPQFIEIMGLLVGRLNELNESLDKNIYSEKENRMVSLAYESMSAALKKVKLS